MSSLFHSESAGLLTKIIGIVTQKEEDHIKIDTNDTNKIGLTFESSITYALSKENGQDYILSLSDKCSIINGNSIAWVLPIYTSSQDSAWLIRAEGAIKLKKNQDKIEVEINTRTCDLYKYRNRPSADIYGKKYSYNIKHGEVFTKTFSSFYWDTLLPSIIERTKAKSYPIRDGYVVSTLEESKYAGTYPDVDHEFQIKGRLAMGNLFDQTVVRRMMELQFKVMEEDPIGLWRNPCAIQPNGVREYHVRRSSSDGKTNAEMFLITGNVEVIESAWLYVAATKNYLWLKDNIDNLEGAASLVESCIDRKGCLWSDVFYEDQVIKDGRECMSASLAANSFKLLAELEKLIGRDELSVHYSSLFSLLSKTLVKSLPKGFWDTANKRFVDWVDRNGDVHDHIHLLANILPIIFNYTDEEQAQDINTLVNSEFEKFERFPSFISPRIEDYNSSEIGDGGPYDLCAAGRYWLWDAAFWSFGKNGAILEDQLCKVASQAEEDHYLMGERYDMNYVYYIDQKNWHGASHYYEYPCVFIWVLIHEYIGIQFCLDADLLIAPKLNDFGDVVLESDGYSIAYEYKDKSFKLRNLADRKRSIKLDLSAIYPNVKSWRVDDHAVSVNTIIEIEANGEVEFTAF